MQVSKQQLVDFLQFYSSQNGDIINMEDFSSKLSCFFPQKSILENRLEEIRNTQSIISKLATDKQVKDTFLKFKDFPPRTILLNVITDLFNKDLGLTSTLLKTASDKVLGKSNMVTIIQSLNKLGVNKGKESNIKYNSADTFYKK